jgi:hypothetical protein
MRQAQILNLWQIQLHPKVSFILFGLPAAHDHSVAHVSIRLPSQRLGVSPEYTRYVSRKMADRVAVDGHSYCVGVVAIVRFQVKNDLDLDLHAMGFSATRKILKCLLVV